MNGFGTKLEGENVYEGYFLNNMKYWEANLKTENGQFTGFFEKDSIVKGKVMYTDGSKYDGEWKDGVMHG